MIALVKRALWQLKGFAWTTGLRFWALRQRPAERGQPCCGRHGAAVPAGRGGARLQATDRLMELSRMQASASLRAAAPPRAPGSTAPMPTARRWHACSAPSTCAVFIMVWNLETSGRRTSLLAWSTLGAAAHTPAALALAHAPSARGAGVGLLLCAGDARGVRGTAVRYKVPPGAHRSACSLRSALLLEGQAKTVRLILAPPREAADDKRRPPVCGGAAHARAPTGSPRQPHTPIHQDACMTTVVARARASRDSRKMVSSIERSVRTSMPSAWKLGRCRKTAEHSQPMYTA